MQWKVYILQCGDGSLYTGVTKDIERRIEQHSKGIGAKYTRGRGPFKLCYCEDGMSHSQALHREYEIKQMTHMQKLALINKNIPNTQ